MTSEESLGGGYGENVGETVSVEASLVDHQAAVDTTTTQIGRVLAQINRTQPFHASMIRPQRALGSIVSLVAARSTSQTVRIEVVQAEHVNRSLNRQIMQLRVDGERGKVLLTQVIQHAAVYHVLVEFFFILRQTDIVQPF